MPYLPVVCLAVAHGFTMLMPLGENLHMAVLPRLFGWPTVYMPQHIANHLGTVIALLIVLHREIGQALRGVWQLLRGRWRPEARLFVNLAIALLPIGALRLAGVAQYVSTYGLGRISYMAITGVAMAAIMLLVDRYSLAIRRVEHMSVVDAIVLGLAQLVAYMPGAGLVPVAITAARMLGFERPDAARIAFLMALGAFAGEVLLGGSQLYLAGELAPLANGELALSVVVSTLSGLFAAAIFLAWLERGSMTPFLVYRLLASAAALGWFLFVFPH
ncbi:MAG: undecaprenyl-diphosphate phosphatase [Alphaproteobacteria bacterium]